MKSRTLLLACAGITILIAACATISETGESRFILTSPQQETQMGLAAFQDLKTSQKISTDQAAIDQVNRVANRLIPVVDYDAAKWEIVVFEDPTPNAFALPGGKIGVHTGILPITKNDAGLAAVIGHEMAHVTLRHGGQRISRQMATSALIGLADIGLGINSESYQENRSLILASFGAGAQYGMALPFSRENEYEADRIGMRYMARAGYHPQEAIELWKRMETFSHQHGNKPPEWMSTHPADANRIKALEEYLPTALAYMP
ncbi:MAG: M48 family metallopeptidase [Verrucomicrobiota bacterium]